MKAADIRSKFLTFYKERGHAIVPAAPIIPVGDSTTLFTSSGMQQLVPYLKGETHPMGIRLVDSQPSFRAEDIDEVGDNRHTTMYEMLGNWSLGDYFKSEQLPWIWEFATKVLGLEKKRLYATLFEGNDTVPKDQESYAIWKKIGLSDDHIFYYGAKKNWWSRAGEPSNMPSGEIGGPTSELFFEFPQVAHDTKFGAVCHPNCDCGRFIEICNSVFMEYQKIDSELQKLPAQNVDFGGGLERLTAAVKDTPDVFMIDIFAPIIKAISVSSDKEYVSEYQAPMRVIADHLRAATFMIASGLTPSNKQQGYVLRRLIRRAAVRGRVLGGNVNKIFADSIPSVVKFYSDAGFISSDTLTTVKTVVEEELSKFAKILDKGERTLAKFKPSDITEAIAFDLFQSDGIPFEITSELVAKSGVTLSPDTFESLRQSHKEQSRSTSAGMFRGGLADNSITTTKYHTATHLLHQALADVLGEEVKQAGSNITAKRLRFDYTYSGKPSSVELQKIEEIINEKINANLPVTRTVEDKDEALKSGARAFFAEKYPDKVSVYSIGDYSRELCGGPHVNSTQEIGKIKLTKDETLGSGVRRIYAELA